MPSFTQSFRTALRPLPWLIWLIALPRAGVAVLFYSTADPVHNTTPPTGTLTNSGWQYQGTWGAFLGTPVAPKFFITAFHVNGSVGDKFHFRGVDYTTTAAFHDPNSDLQLWRVCGTFPDYAPLYSHVNESSRPVVVFGRGTQRGAEVSVFDGVSNVLKGWMLGTPDSVQRWGTNVVAIASGDFLKCTFDASGGADEADLSVGDSGGGVFIRDGGVWKLAGVNLAVDGPYNTTTNGFGFAAALFDQGGLYTLSGTNWVLIPDTTTDRPGGFYATRISTRLTWINNVLQSAPADPPPVLLSASSVLGPFVEASNAIVDTNAKIVTVPASPDMQFYVLRACDPLQITGISINGSSVVLTYQ